MFGDWRLLSLVVLNCNASREASWCNAKLRFKNIECTARPLCLNLHPPPPHLPSPLSFLSNVIFLTPHFQHLKKCLREETDKIGEEQRPNFLICPLVEISDSDNNSFESGCFVEAFCSVSPLLVWESLPFQGARWFPVIVIGGRWPPHLIFLIVPPTAASSERSS